MTHRNRGSAGARRVKPGIWGMSSLLVAWGVISCGPPPLPDVTSFIVDPPVFCPGTDVHVSWATSNAHRTVLALDGAILDDREGLADDATGEFVIPHVAASGRLSLSAIRNDYRVEMTQQLTLFRGQHTFRLSTADCAGSTPQDDFDVDTNGLPLIVSAASAAPEPVTLTHSAEMRRHPPDSWTEWQGHTVQGTWSITGAPQPGRTCQGASAPNSVSPVALTLVGSCSGKGGLREQSIEPARPEKHPLDRLHCGGDVTGADTEAFVLWVVDGKGCAKTETYWARSEAEATACAETDHLTVRGNWETRTNEPDMFDIGCNGGTSTFRAYSPEEACSCASDWCDPVGHPCGAGLAATPR